MPQSRNLEEFLRKNATKEKTGITHTRIGNTELGVFGWKGLIEDNDVNEFYNLYAAHLEKKPEFLTEVQHKDNGPILVDLDFRYNPSVNKRKHDFDTIAKNTK